MGRSGGNHQAKNCERYKAEGRKEKNRQKKATKWQKFVEYCKNKWSRGKRTPRGTARQLRRSKKNGRAKTVQAIPKTV